VIRAGEAAPRMHDLRCPVGFTGARQASAPAQSVRLELGAANTPMSPEPPPWKMVTSSAPSWLFGGAGKTSPATMHTEFDMRAPLFPKEQVFNPNPPARLGPLFLA
jgi:hypothetical protein